VKISDKNIQISKEKTMWVIIGILGLSAGWVAGVHLPWPCILFLIAASIYLVAENKLGEGLAAIPSTIMLGVMNVAMIIAGIIFSEITLSGVGEGIKMLFTGG